MARARFASIFCVFWSLGCPGLPTFPTYGPDAVIECDDETNCPGDEVCLQGRCYAPCTATSCGPLEVCTAGVCMPRTGDAGMDAGRDTPPADTPPDPCIMLMCSGMTRYCRRATCVPCTEVPGEEQCGLGTPICLVARNSCVAAGMGGTCEPCNDDGDCVDGRTCRSLGTSALERVCLPSCPGTCPAGTTCDAGLGACRPSGGVSCFQYRAALTAAMCTNDADCAPAGATSVEGLFTDTCVMGRCRYPCGVTADCPTGTCNITTSLCE